MLGSLAAITALLALAAPFVQATFWGVPFGLLSIRMVVRSVLSTALTTFLAGMLAMGCLSLGPDLSAMQRGAVGATAGGLVGLGLLLLSVTRLRRYRGALLLAHRLRESDIRDTAWSALRALLNRAKPRDPNADHSGYAGLVLVIIAPLTQANMWDEAEALLQELPPERIDARQRGLRAQALATCRLQREDTEGAREAIDHVERPAQDPSVEAWLRATDALLLAVEGEADRALEVLEQHAEEEDGGDGSQAHADQATARALLQASERIVRAHAFASKNQPDRAREELEAVVQEVGEPGLERALSPPGPASDLARDIQRERSA